MGIGHRVKSLENPDSRVTIVKEFVKTQFPKCPLFDFALEVEKITTTKRSNLILNVDGAIAVAFVDLLRESGQFTKYIFTDFLTEKITLIYPPAKQSESFSATWNRKYVNDGPNLKKIPQNFPRSP